jgi:hypothetical protein
MRISRRQGSGRCLGSIERDGLQGGTGRVTGQGRATQAGGRWRPHLPREDVAPGESCEPRRTGRLAMRSARLEQGSGPPRLRHATCCARMGEGGAREGATAHRLASSPFRLWQADLTSKEEAHSEMELEPRAHGLKGEGESTHEERNCGFRGSRARRCTGLQGAQRRAGGRAANLRQRRNKRAGR